MFNWIQKISFNLFCRQEHMFVPVYGGGQRGVTQYRITFLKIKGVHKPALYCGYKCVSWENPP